MNEGLNVPSRETEVSRVLSKLAQVTGNCEKSLEELRTRLSSVCNKDDEANEKISEPEYSTPLAQEINKIVYRIERLNDLMNSLQNRIEL
jgi:lipid A disaccharide synthetase